MKGRLWVFIWAGWVVFLFHSCAHMGENVSSTWEPTLLVTPELSAKVLSLDPRSISDKEVTEILSQCPAPRVFSLNGSIPIVTMDSFGKFFGPHGLS